MLNNVLQIIKRSRKIFRFSFSLKLFEHPHYHETNALEPLNYIIDAQFLAAEYIEIHRKFMIRPVIVLSKYRFNHDIAAEYINIRRID